MTWNPVNGAANCGINVVDITAGSSVYYNNVLSNVSSVPLPEGVLVFGHNFQWYVWGEDSLGAGPNSIPFYFQVQRPPPPPPTLIGPGSGTSPGPTLNNLSATFEWTRSADATNYGLYIYDATARVYVVVNDTLGDVASFPLPVGVLTGTHSYRWNMRASNSGGFGNYAPYLYFQTPLVPPTLGYLVSGRQIIFSWPTNSSGFTLEQATTLPPTSWAVVSPAPIIVGTNYTVTNTISTGARFFRLRNP